MVTTSASELPVESFVPPLPQGGVVAPLPVRQVTLLEDRAQVTRSGTVELVAGLNRLRVMDVAPVLQDVSLRAATATTAARVADVRVRRINRVRRADKPEAAAALEARIEALQRDHQAVLEEQATLLQRSGRMVEVLQYGAQELPQDAGWGVANHGAWKESFEAAFGKMRQANAAAMAARFKAQDLELELRALVRQRQALDRLEHSVVAFLELDVEAQAAGSALVTVEYVVPNALWRPMHTAQLEGGTRLRWNASAVVWQATGEAWNDVELRFSTARSSLGTEPPLLRDDPLTVKKKQEQVVVAAREVAVQKAGLGSGGGGGGARPGAVDLPGVDDGGETRNIKAPSPVTVPSDGRPNVVPLFTFEDAATFERVCFPELDAKVFLRVRARNAAPLPLLAGPVELLLDHGQVGWTSCLFVAPQERFELGFGPDDAVRVVRREREKTELDQVSRWNTTTRTIQLYFSNLSGDARPITVTERIPVSEIEHVKVAVTTAETTGAPKVDDNGFVTWNLTLEPQGHARATLVFTVSTAPGVQSA